MAGRIDENLNPMANIYNEFSLILKKITIKYGYLAEKYETLETKQLADQYLDAYYCRDDFFTYSDYTPEEFNSVGFTDILLRAKASGNVKLIPKQYRDDLLAVRRQNIINTFEEQNNYYRMLNGYPPIETKSDKYHYVPKNICDVYNIDQSIPIHKIQDYYNHIESGRGDILISRLEGIKLIDELISEYPTEEYLQYLGSNRITLYKARTAKNFEILRLDPNDIRHSVFDMFVSLYDQCRDYYMSVIYNSQFKAFIDYYDQFIAMCIMIMTIQQLIVKQIPNTIRRNFFDIYSVKMLYDCYNIPYDLYIDEETQNSIAQNLNLLIKNKATDKVIYDAASLLGFSNIKAYKYYLFKEHKYDQYGVPVFKYTNRFNENTGEYETVPDYEAMYDLYFQKEEINDDDFVQSFNSKVNKVNYDDIVTNDPYWWEDSDLYARKWETEYNFVETKYLSLSVSYKMTDILYENILLLKLLIAENSPLADLTVSVPKLIDGVEEPIFDLVILLLCLVAKKHVLTGEIISIPSQVISVLDYLQNVEAGNNTVDTFSYNFEYLNSVEGTEEANKIKKILGDSDAKLFASYLSVLDIQSAMPKNEKISALNKMYSNIKNLQSFLSYKMTSCSDRKLYESLKTFYRAAFYSKEVKDVFTITGEYSGTKRTAKNFFEFLYYRNPKLYNTLFTVDYEESYLDYKVDHPDDNDISFDDFMLKVEKGEIDVCYDTLINEKLADGEEGGINLYYYVNHIISRIKTLVTQINFLYLINDSSTPLEELLLKIIKFVKSFTVDLLSLDTIYICDMKIENLIRFMDEVHYVEKEIYPKDYANLSFSDVVHKFIVHNKFNDGYKFNDILLYNTNMMLDNHHELTTNRIHMSDNISYRSKLDKIDDRCIVLFDNVDAVESELTVNSKKGLKLSDKVSKVWYSD